MATHLIHRADTNAASIIAALRCVGASVALIGQPVDLVVGFRGRNYLLEIKTRKGRPGARQRAFFASWQGDARIVRSAEDALACIGAMRGWREEQDAADIS